MEITMNEFRNYKDRISCPQYYAAKDIAENHDLKIGSVEYQAFQSLWCANGKWCTLARIFLSHDIDRERWPYEVEEFLLDDSNECFLDNLIIQAKALSAMYESCVDTKH